MALDRAVLGDPDGKEPGRFNGVSEMSELELSRILRRIMLEGGMTIDGLADDTGVGRTTIWAILHSTRSATMHTVGTLLDALGYQLTITPKKQ